MHTSVSGVADYFAKDENESFEQVRDIISGLNLISPKEFDPTENMPRFESTELDYFGGLNSLDLEDMKAVIARFVDDSRFSEFKSSFGKNLVTGFAKICDQLVGICANSGKCFTFSRPLLSSLLDKNNNLNSIMQEVLICDYGKHDTFFFKIHTFTHKKLMSKLYMVLLFDKITS